MNCSKTAKALQKPLNSSFQAKSAGKGPCTRTLPFTVSKRVRYKLLEQSFKDIITRLKGKDINWDKIHLCMLLGTNKREIMKKWNQLEELDKISLLKQVQVPDKIHKAIINSGDKLLISTMCMGQKLKYQLVMKYKHVFSPFDKKVLGNKYSLYKVLLNQRRDDEDRLL